MNTSVPKGRKVNRNKPKRLQDKKHLQWVASHGCCCCGAHPVEVHHLLRADPSRGMGRKAADKYTIPLCPTHHRALHDCGDEILVLEKYGVDGPSLAASLWEPSHE